MPTRLAQPRNAYAVSGDKALHLAAHRLDSADDLVARYQGQVGHGELAVDDVEIGSTDCAGLNTQADFMAARFRDGSLLHPQRVAALRQDHRPHHGCSRQGQGRVTRPLAAWCCRWRARATSCAAVGWSTVSQPLIFGARVGRCLST